MNRAYNFGAGPAMLPEPILKAAQEELLNWQNSGMSIMEIGHRTPEFMELMAQAEQDLRDLLKIPANYHVLFLGGAARTQFGMIPLNFLKNDEQAGYFITGLWSSFAYQEACKLKKAYCVASDEKNGFIRVPLVDEWQLKEKTSYLYFTSNETINGVRFPQTPVAPGIPLIVDMTSSLLSEPIQVENYDLIFAGAQKNIANAGLTVVIVKEEWLHTIGNQIIPTMLDYRVHIAEKSIYATPPTFNCYMAAKMFQWVKAQGGVEALYAENCKKAAKLYRYIDSSSFYYCKVVQEYRSLMNVCFNLRDTTLESLFLEQAQQRNLLALKGHRAVGGLRASIYNAMPFDGVNALIEFMCDFAKEYYQ
ncbi:3-phosphoserine aminotransferase [Legionella hackeliae]|uniref:Phosphoserine aminotransferase n=2 Tax=Legionella hackeliae TaxID=449 RepID=A0A0A8UQ78_LEGHA|nr:3-phosphoserine aminotransferase [Legionella hackeliae]CEK10913.1 Phosphoserine aminotransferase [Legionella hackeliae]STX47651.1 3-phosphoserine aminotransferase [Legionella hackeliae]